MVDIVLSQPVSILAAPTPGGGIIEGPLTTAASPTLGGVSTSGENDATTVSFADDSKTTPGTTASTLDTSEVDIMMSSQENPNSSTLTTSTTVALTADGIIEIDYRERGLSFEFFSFGMNEDEPLPPTTQSAHDVVGVKEEDTCDQEDKNGSSHPLLPPLVPQQSVGQSKRPRGDSIIFDPVSFSDGGIHEENALLKTRGVSSNLIMSLDEKEELALMNSPGFVETNATSGGTAVAPARPDACTSFRTDDALPPMTSSSTTNSQSAHQPLTASSSNAESSLPDASATQKTQQHPVPSPIDCSTSAAATSSVSTPAADPGGAATANSQQQTWTTAASNTAVTTTTADSNNNASATINHSITTCPLELVNKDGRIGIYRPEARKARIAKFHSKRKMRIWRKRIKYDCRKKLADSRPRIKGRFVKRSDEDDEGH